MAGSLTMQAQQYYQNHPVAQACLAELKTQYDARQRNAEAPRSLEEFYTKLDLNGTGEVRYEDFKAGWGLGGVKLHPHQLSTMKAAHGTEQGTVRYREVLEQMDTLPYEMGVSVVMKNRMGAVTAAHCGYKQQGPPMKGYLGDHHHIAPKLRTDSARHTPARSGISPNSLLRSTHITPVVTPPTDVPNRTFNTTCITTAALTQRHKSMVSISVAATLERIRAASVADPQMLNTLQSLDAADTGCVTLDAFLTACARAGLTLRPDELDALRQSGFLRRPYNEAPELIEYAALELGDC